MEEALTLARPGGCIRPFVEAGPAMAAMLRPFARRSDEQDFTRQVLAALETESGPTPQESPETDSTKLPSATVQAGPDALTNRELDILELLTQRLQNKEIADQLFISPHTVNYHLKHIYDKLGVNDRRRAVDRAVELGILKQS